MVYSGSVKIVDSGEPRLKFYWMHLHKVDKVHVSLHELLCFPKHNIEKFIKNKCKKIKHFTDLLG